MSELKSSLSEKCSNTEGTAKRVPIDRLVEAEHGGNTETFTAGSEGAQSASSGETTITEHLDEGIRQKDKPRLHIGVILILCDTPEHSVPEVFKDAAVTVTNIDREQSEIAFIAGGKRQSWSINAIETVGVKPFSVKTSLAEWLRSVGASTRCGHITKRNGFCSWAIPCNIYKKLEGRAMTREDTRSRKAARGLCHVTQRDGNICTNEKGECCVHAPEESRCTSTLEDELSLRC